MASRCAYASPVIRPAYLPGIRLIGAAAGNGHRAALCDLSELPTMTTPTVDSLVDLSAAIGRRVQAAARLLVSISGERGRIAAILWRPDLIVASEQSLPKQESYAVTLPGGGEAVARPAGRDSGTNVALLQLELADPVADAQPPAAAGDIAVGALALSIGTGEAGTPTARLTIVRATGPVWHSMAGGRIDQLIKLDLRLEHSEDGGPVVDAAGDLLGMATAGPRGRALVIPHATIERVIEPLRREGRLQRGWIGVGLQPVAVPEALRAEAGQSSGMMVMSLAPSGPAEQAGVLPGDILLTLDGQASLKQRALGALLGPERVGQPIAARLLRAGTVVRQTIMIGARPAT
jgi:S1-C subfamily serine protease